MKQLQKIVFEDTELKGLTTQELIKLNQPVGDIFSIYKLYSKAIALHRIALNKEMVGLEPSETTETKSTNNESTSARSIKDDNPHYRSILVELNHLIASYAQKKPNDQQLNDIKQRLDEGMDEDQLLKSCVVILRMIVQDAMSEASLTGKVIQSLHRSLGEVSSDVSNTIQGSQAQFEQRQAGNEQLKRDIIHIEEAVSESSSLEALKEQTKFCVEKLVTTLIEQQSNDQQGQEALMALLSSMQSRIDTLQQQTSVYKKKLAEQAMQSRTDPLTRLPNRQAYNERLEAAFTKFKENGDLLAVAVVDIDHFKSINDRYGHLYGDEVLILLAQLLRQHFGEHHDAYRYGGEEFAALISARSDKGARQLLERFRAAVEGTEFPGVKQVTVSIGYAPLEPGKAPPVIIERADRALYEAKGRGRNRVVDVNALLGPAANPDHGPREWGDIELF